MMIQFNSKDAKNFRITMAKANSALGTLADYVALKSDRVKALNTIIATNDADLEKLAKGEKGVLRKESDILAETESIKAKLQAESDALKVARTDCDKAMADAMGLFPKSVYLSYCEYIADRENKSADYAKAIADALVNAGVKDATADNCAQFVGIVGKRRLKGKSAVKAQANTGAVSEKVWRDLFVADLCDTLVTIKAISEYKYSYVFPQKKAN